ncbi:uncharacterized protein [Antedon mediterranea]|uniref:uncharacterized protein n=1 Tax=Antedon mediterranea TaxID=105859 RepID=UPI003AF4C345
MGYADDHSVYDSFNPNSSSSMENTITKLQECLISINDWMKSNRLKMNSEKTEFILLGSRAQLLKCEKDHIIVCQDRIPRGSSVKYLGVNIDDQLSFKNHIRDKCRTIAVNLYYIRQIRKFLSKDLCQQLVQSLVLSHIDYANALYYGLPANTLAPMKRLLHQAAKIIVRKGRYDSATNAMRSLHWLPMSHRYQFKIACLVWLSLKGSAPSYLRDILTVRNVSRRTRSSASNYNLTIPRTKRKTFADRSFAVAGPKI